MSHSNFSTAGEDLRYFILPGKLNNHATQYVRSLYEQAYKYWKGIWVTEITKVGGDPSYVSANDFLRQDAISVICAQNSIVGMMLHTIYDLSTTAVRECKYLSIFPNQCLQALEQKGVRSFNTMEFLAVHPEWRTNKTGIRMGSLVLIMSVQFGRESGVQANLGVARADVKVNDVLYSLGGTKLHRTDKNNTPVELVAVYCGEIKEHDDKNLATLAKSLWANRIDLRSSGKDFSVADQQQIAA